MSSSCKKIQQMLATEGPRALQRDDEARQHLVDCDVCFRFLESLTEIEDGLGSMAQFDAPDTVVDSLLARPEIASGGTAVSGTSLAERIRAVVASLLRPRPLVWSSIAAASLIVALAVGLRFRLPDAASTQGLNSPEGSSIGSVGEKQKLDTANAERRQAIEQLRNESKRFRELQAPEVDTLESRGDDSQQPKDDQRITGQDKNEDGTRFTDEFISDLPVPGRFYTTKLPQAPGVEDSDPDGKGNVHDSRSRDLKATVGGVSSAGPTDGDRDDRQNANSIEELENVTREVVAAPPPPPPKQMVRKKPVPSPKPVAQSSANAPLIAGVGGVTHPILIDNSRVTPEYPEIARTARIEAHVILQVVVGSNGSVSELQVLQCNRPEMGFEQAAIDAVRQWRFKPALQGDVAVDVYWTIRVDFDLDAEADNSLLQPDEALQSARDFLAARGTLDNLSYKAATGYWSNSYVPGDPALRLLQAKLAGWDRSTTQAYLPAARLHDASRQVGQPFDTPDASALAVYMQADRRGLTESGRMLVQVGIEGTPRHGGRRPAMNVALVLDLRHEIESDVAIGLRALLEAFNRAQEPGDSFRLFVAGRPGGCVVAPGDFRHGYLKVTLDRLIESRQAGLDLVGAVSSAIESVAAADDPEAPLGSNAVVLISGRPFARAAHSLAELAHQGAVAGIPLSVIGVGDDVALDDIDLVTLAGQGNRRLLDDPAGATALVERELSAASRAIARAVRLRIRLAPGVKLVDVLGSERLDEPRAERVRQAERSIDLRLARRLGIEADRGEDEQGIQIVVPSFYAGDSHAILLDVVVPGPGPVADVTVRYKDLVHLRNGTSRASLSLGRDTRSAGPLERNVLKNLLSVELSETLEQAGLALETGDRERALSLLQERTALLDGLRRDLPGFANDPDLLCDLAMLGEYRTLLASGFATEPGQRSYLADSLRYAARLKVLPRPLETTS